jgi:hypothetical protein
VAVPPLPLLVVLPPPLALLTPLLLRRRSRVRRISHTSRQAQIASLLTPRFAEKEESDDDMGFGLFD